MQLVGLPSQLPCPQCRGAMVHLSLAGRMDAVVVDHCEPCRLVWFDRLESVQLVGLGWVALLRELQQGERGPPMALQAGPLACPVCRKPLKTVHNRTRFGHFRVLECTGCQGHLHSHSGLLAERGLVRPLLWPERQALAQQRRALCCLNCGAPADGSGEDCSYCTSPLVMLDLPRLAHALRLRPGRHHEDAPLPAGRPLAWPCRGCGAPLDPSRQITCPQCTQAVVVPSLLDITPLLDAIEAELRADAAPVSRPARRGLKRKRHWQETGLGRIAHWLRPEAAEPQQWLPSALGLLALLAWWTIF